MSYYRAVMRSDAARSDEGAVGSHTHESWLKIGQVQFDYLDHLDYLPIVRSCYFAVRCWRRLTSHLRGLAGAEPGRVL